MEQGKAILRLLEERSELFTHLKELLLKQQKAMVEADTERITTLAEAQVKCMEDIHKSDRVWRKMVDRIKDQYKLNSSSVEEVITKVLNQTQCARFYVHLDKIKKTASEIDIIKRNNTLLIHNSLALVRSTLKHLQADRPMEMVYHPNRKQAMGHILFNKKL